MKRRGKVMQWGNITKMKCNAMQCSTMQLNAKK